MEFIPMTKDQTIKKSKTSLRVVVVTVLTTLLVAGGGAYLLGYLGPREDGKIVEKASANTADTGQQTERKIAYWRAPMVPTEIYDEPGKSAMGMDLVPIYEDEITDQADGEEAERKIAYWRAPMVPAEIYDKPGKSAMGMDLVPVYEDELVGGVAVKIDPVTQQNMGLRTAIAKKGPLIHTIRTYGHITYDETRTAQISPKSSGWIEKIHVDFTGKFVEKGQPLFEIYSPELLTAQEEYMVAYRNLRRTPGMGNQELLASARRRLKYFDVAESEIQDIETSGQIKKTITIRSPFSGIVTHKMAEEGSYIKAGTTIYRIADLSRVWVEAHIYEYELPWISEGQPAEMTLPYLPGQMFTGKVFYVYPYLQPKTRDIIIRLEFENPDLLLKPEMYADIRLKVTEKEEGLIIPSEAVIRSGERNLVFVTRDSNKFTPRDVTLGLALDDRKVQILTGLAPGETVVTSGQFLLDSESKLKEAVQKMMEAKKEKAKAAEKEAEEDFFNDLEEDEDFFKDMKEEEDFFRDLEKE
jgi:Cu(I)/Ag(I) efflux system membrane fusion protein/cobalt-zinc-cadmium efflux system membrane fusion protein